MNLFLYMFSIMLVLTFMGLASLFTVMDLTVFISWELFSSSNLSFEFPLYLDFWGVMFFFSVSLIFGSVMAFSKSYMSQELYFHRFHWIVMLFVVSMFLLILSPNLISVLVGWDGLGVTSYLLVIYFNSNKSFNAGLLTALTNRVGDCFILVAIALLLSKMMWNFSIFTSSLMFSLSSGFILLMCATASTKSAQIPFSAWLPAAMAAPTPVSSLVHSSTLVTAGVYLLIRFNSMTMASGVSSALLITGTMTMFMAGLSALFEMDMKKIVALSTLSQLGLMMSCLGLGWFKISFFHLLTHAYFKALLFIGVGNLIHQMNSFQDLRKISVSPSSLSASLSFISLANLSLCGLPFMAGFFSKDLFLELSYCSPINSSALALFGVSTALTAAYTMRFFILISMSTSRNETLRWTSDQDMAIISGLASLASLAVVSGSALIPKFAFYSPIWLPMEGKNMTLFIVLMGFILGKSLSKPMKNSFQSTSVGNMWSLPLISAPSWSQKALMMSDRVQHLSEKLWIESLPFTILRRKTSINFQFINNYNLNAATMLALFMLFYLWLIY